MFSTPVCGRRSALPRAGMLRPANRGRVASSHVVSHAIVFAGSTKYVRQIRRRPSRRSGPFRRTRRSHRRRPSRRRPNRWFCRWLVAILPAAQALSRISGMESSGQAPGKFMHRQGLCDRGMKKRAGGLAVATLIRRGRAQMRATQACFGSPVISGRDTELLSFWPVQDHGP
jgi:hypothetical protein